MTAPEILSLIVERGPALCRAAAAAGISSVEISADRVSIRFAPPYGGVDAAAAAPAADEPPVEAELEVDALDDPATYEGGDVPGYEFDEEPA